MYLMSLSLFTRQHVSGESDASSCCYEAAPIALGEQFIIVEILK